MIIQLQSVGPIGDIVGAVVVNVPWNIPNPLGSITAQLLTQGANTTVAAQVGASICVIIPPVANTQAYTIKGAAADTGIVSGSGTAASIASVIPCSQLVSNQFYIFLAAGTNQTFTLVWL